MERLVLFDIDETMISSDGVGRRAIGRMLLDMFKIPPEKITVSMSGKTDPQILREILIAAELNEEEIHQRLDQMYKIYISLLKEEIKKEGRYIVHSGVVEILDRLKDHPKTYLALLTGNIEEGARIKLDKFGLNHYFPFGAYGSDSADRMKLPEIAKRRALEHYRIDFRPDQVVIVGDSIYDVMCAKGYGAKCIAVNTGVTPRADLEKYDPEHLFVTLEDTEQVLAAILS